MFTSLPTPCGAGLVSKPLREVSYIRQELISLKRAILPNQANTTFGGMVLRTLVQHPQVEIDPKTGEASTLRSRQWRGTIREY